MKRSSKYYQLKNFILFCLFVVLFTISCTSEKQSVPDECEGNISIQSTVLSDSNCGLSNGSFEIIAAGGTGDYTFSLNNSSPQTSAVFNNLEAGTYTVLVTDALSCTNEVSVTIANLDGVNASISAVTDSDCDNPDGTITIEATGGVEPYEYKLDDNSFQGNSNFSALGPGQYTVTVKDASGCEVSLQAEIKSEVVFAQIKSIIETNCAISGCHNGNTFPDLRVDANIANQASRIRTRTAARSMPPTSSGRSLSASEIAEIACWVNDGASLD